MSTSRDRLPSGRQARATLTREDVVAHQRRRILRAITDEVAERGYPAVTVAHVIARAGVSRATFYEQFPDKQACFLAAFDHAVAVVLRGDDTAVSVPLDQLLAGYLAALTTHPALARVFLVEIQALGPAGVVRRSAGQRRFADLVQHAVGARTKADRFACEAFVAATGALVGARLAAGEHHTLPDLHGPLLDVARRLFG